MPSGVLEELLTTETEPGDNLTLWSLYLVPLSSLPPSSLSHLHPSPIVPSQPVLPLLFSPPQSSSLLLSPSGHFRKRALKFSGEKCPIQTLLSLILLNVICIWPGIQARPSRPASQV